MNVEPITCLSHMSPNHARTVLNVLTAALQAVEPGAAVARFLQRQGHRLTIGDQTYDLNQVRNIFLVGAGKAGAPMAAAAAQVLKERLTAGCVIVKDGYAAIPAAAQVEGLQRVQLVEAGHPLPDERGIAGAQQIRSLLIGLDEHDLVICLISGGGSALLVSPAEGVRLADLQALTSELLACGAPIHEINVLRKHLDTFKGGGLARAAAPAHLATLILSDVVGDPLDVIASGPTVPDSSTFVQAYDILCRYHLIEKIPPAIRQHLEMGLRREIADTPKTGDPIFEKVQNMMIGSNRLAAEAALRQAQGEGLHAMLLTTFLQGEARQAARLLTAIARQIDASGQPVPRPACLVAGGETTVTLQGNGLGGRNQELALAAVAELNGLPEVAFVTLATDGGDGPTDAAGAVVSGSTWARAQSAGLDPAAYLAANDSYHFFQSLGDLVITGPTQTNVNDLNFIFAF